MSFDADRLVHLLYDAVDEHADLCSFLSQMVDGVGANGAHYLVIDRGAAVEMRSIGNDASEFARYEDWRPQDPRFALATARAGETLMDADLPDWDGFARSALMNEYLIPTGTRYSLFATYNAGPALVMAQAFLRRPNQEPFSETERRRVQTIVPHLARATRLRHLVRTLRADLGDLERALDASPSALAVLDSRGRTIALNARCRALLATFPGLFADPRVRGAIRCSATFAEGTRARGTNPRPPRTVTVARHGAPALSVLVHPLRPRVDLRRAAPAARVLVVIHDPAAVIALDRDLVAHLHGLTATEAELAASLAEGRTVADFAKARGISELTVRTHLKHVLDKTGARRQAELVRMLLSGAALHAVSS